MKRMWNPQRAKYRTDLTDGQWQILRHFFRKRHIVVDTLGLVLAVVVHAADEQDRHGGLLMPDRLWEKMKGIKVHFGDSAYLRGGVPDLDQAHAGSDDADRTPARRRHRFVVLPKCWIAERAFSWLGRYRRLSKDYERTVESSEAMVHISIIQMMSWRLATAIC